MHPNEVPTGNGANEVLIPGALVDGRYRLASIATRNQSGMVFNAVDERSRCRVRVRVSHHAPVGELVLVEDPGLPAVTASGRSGLHWWMVHTWFDGEPIRLPSAPRERITSRALQGWGEAFVQLLDILSVLHASGGRCHGSLSLESLWLGQDGRIRVIDAATPDGVLRPNVNLWASPERLQGLPCTPASDVYGAAAIFWALALGRPPFGHDPVEARSGHLGRPLPPAPGLPEPIVTLLHKALAKDPKDRFAHPAALRESLAPIFGFGPARGSAPDVIVGPADVGGTLDPLPPRRVQGRRLGSLTLGLLFTGLSVPVGLALAVVACGILTGLVVVGMVIPTLMIRPLPAPVAAVSTERSVDEVVDGIVDPTVVNPSASAQPTPGGIGGADSVAAVADGGIVPLRIPDLPPLPPPPMRVPVSFAYDSWQPALLADFDGFSSQVGAWEGPVELVGHTDTFGSPKANYLLGLGRAWAVQQLLVARGIDESRVPIRSAGETDPLAGKDDPDASVVNRRVMAEFGAVPTP